MSLAGNHPSPPLILKLALLRRQQWLVRVMMVDAHAVGAPTAITASCHPVAQGWAPPLVSHRRQSGEFLSYADACLGLLLCRDANLCLLIGVGTCLLHTQ
jgi:hypothetical protein